MLMLRTTSQLFAQKPHISSCVFQMGSRLLVMVNTRELLCQQLLSCMTQGKHQAKVIYVHYRHTFPQILLIPSQLTLLSQKPQTGRTVEQTLFSTILTVNVFCLIHPNQEFTSIFLTKKISSLSGKNISSLSGIILFLLDCSPFPPHPTMCLSF